MVNDTPWWDKPGFRPFRINDLLSGQNKFLKEFPGLSQDEIRAWIEWTIKDLKDVYTTQKIYENRVRELEGARG